MKTVFMAALMLLSTAVNAQDELREKRPALPDTHSDRKYPSLLDSSHKYTYKYGKVGRLKQDNMPCIWPAYREQMPNALKHRTPAPNDIPNLWKKDSTDH